MVITRIDPFRRLAVIDGRLDRLFNEPFLHDGSANTPGDWLPPVDIFETDRHDLVIKVELPDVAREDIEVAVDRSTLTIKGVKKATGDVRKEQYRHVERTCGTFSRSFALPDTVDAGKVTADYRNGVLTVTLPYRDEARPRTVTIDVAA